MWSWCVVSRASESSPEREFGNCPTCVFECWASLGLKNEVPAQHRLYVEPITHPTALDGRNRAIVVVENEKAPCGLERTSQPRDVLVRKNAVLQHPDRDCGVNCDTAIDHRIEHLRWTGEEAVRLHVGDSQGSHGRADIDPDHAAAMARDQLLRDASNAAAIIDQ